MRCKFLPSKPSFIGRWPALLRAATTLLLALTSGLCAAEEAQTLRLRVAWGGGPPVRWMGRATLDQGTLEGLKLLGRQRDTPGSIQLIGGRVQIVQPRARQFDGFDITASAPHTATLRLELLAQGATTPHVIETTLGELLTRQHRIPLDDQGNTLLVHRAKDDVLRLKVADDDLIFAPSETVRFEVTPVIANLPPGAALDMSVELFDSSEWRSLTSDSRRITLPARGTTPTPWEIPLPAEQGVYTLRVAARTPPGNRVPFWGSGQRQEQLATREFQVIVVDPQPLRRFAAPEWKTVLEIDPANPRWWNRLPEWSRLGRWTGSAAQPTGSGPFRTTQRHGRTLAEIPPTGSPTSNSTPAWQSYPLPGARPGRPHVVEIDLPVDVPLQLVMRLYEENGAGTLVPTTTPRGVATDEWTVQSGSKQLVTHRLLFWPRTSTPVLVLQNIHPDESFAYGTIRLREALPQRQSVEPSLPQRPLVARFAMDQLLERFAARRFDSQGRLAIDDSQTFYDAAQRLADFLELGGYTGAVVTMFADGGAAFNTQHYPATPALNSSRLATGTIDLPEVDPLRIFLHVLAQRGLTLTPALRFNSTLPELENELAQPRTELTSLVWTAPDGRPRPLMGEDGEPAVPHYNLGHELLENSVAQLVDGLLSDYSDQPALAGVALELTTDSYLTLPPPESGITRQELSRFAAARDTHERQLQEWIDDPRTLLSDDRLRQQWAAQRASAATRLFQAVAARVEAHQPQHSLLLLTDQLFASPEYAPLVRPRLTSTTRLEEACLQRGVDLQALVGSDRIAVPSVARDTLALPLVDAATALHLSELASRQENPFGEGSLLVQQPRQVVPPAVGAGGTTPATAVVFDPLGNSQHQRLLAHFGHSAAGPLWVGGRQGPAADIVVTRQLLGLLSQIPLSSRSTATDRREEQPVVVQVHRDVASATAVATNSSPWPVTATITLDVAAPARGERLAAGDQQRAPSDYTSGQHAWTVELPPFGIEAMRFDSPEVVVSGLRTRFEPSVVEGLKTHLRELEKRDLAARVPYDQLANASFDEIDAQGQPVGWLVGEADAQATGLRTTTPGMQSSHALRLASDGQGQSALSNTFAVPPTGQIAMVAYVKGTNLAPDSRVRLAVELVGSNSSPQFIELTQSRLAADRAGQEWVGYRFGLETLPLDSRAQMRVRLELVGAGEVAIDGLQLYQVVFPLDLYKADSDYQRLAIAQRIETARKALDERRYNDCLAQVEAYWSRFLLEHLPEVAPPKEEIAAPAAPAGDANEANPKLSERLKNLFRF